MQVITQPIAAALTAAVRIMLAAAAAMLSVAHAATATSNVHVADLDYRPLTNDLNVHLEKSDGTNINADGGCDTFWITVPATDQLFTSMLLTAQSRNAEVYVNIKLIPNTTTCEIWRFITYE